MPRFRRFKSPNIESYAGDPMILDIDNVSHPVKNLEKAVLFYRDVLQLDLRFIAKEVGWAEFDVGGSTLALREIRSGFVPSQSSICFLVTEIEEEVERLKKEGIHFLGEIEDIAGGQGRFVGFLDVDGNRLDFYEPPQ
jgi:predicted enzyme related to lactoylglutathione lyase